MLGQVLLYARDIVRVPCLALRALEVLLYALRVLIKLQHLLPLEDLVDFLTRRHLVDEELNGLLVVEILEFKQLQLVNSILVEV